MWIAGISIEHAETFSAAWTTAQPLSTRLRPVTHIRLMELHEVSGEKSFKIIRSHPKVFLFYTWVKVDPMTMNEQRVSCKFGVHETDLTLASNGVELLC